MKKKVTNFIALTIIAVAVIVLTISCSHDSNLYRIQKDGLYGFINKSGKTVIEPQFAYVGNFTKDGFALIILDVSITTVATRDTNAFCPDTVLKVSYNYIDKRGNTLLSSNEEIYLFTRDSWLLFNNPKDFISKFESHTLDFTEYVLPELNLNSNRYLFQNDEYLVGYKDKDGKVVIEPSFRYGRSMEDGMTFVEVDVKPLNINSHAEMTFMDFLKKNINRSRLIDANGNIITEMNMCNISDFNDCGYAWVSVAHIDTTLEIEQDWFRINRVGRITCGPVSMYRGTVYNNYHSKEPLYVTSITLGSLGTYYTWVNDRGDFLTDFDHSGTLSMSFVDDPSEVLSDVTTFSEGMAGVRMYNGNSESVWLFVDKEMNVVSEPYDSVFPFVNGFAAVQEKHPDWPHYGKWGFVGFNMDSSIVQKIPFIFSKVGSFNKDGLAYAAVHGTGFIKEGYINKNGEFVWETLRKK